MLSSAKLVDYTFSCVLAANIMELFASASKTISNVLALFDQSLQLWIYELLDEMKQLCIAMAQGTSLQLRSTSLVFTFRYAEQEPDISVVQQLYQTVAELAIATDSSEYLIEYMNMCFAVLQASESVPAVVDKTTLRRLLIFGNF